MKVVSLVSPPEELEVDLCERAFKYMRKNVETIIDRIPAKRAFDVKKLVEKEKFRSLYGRSPDDGDGAALATAPEFVFKERRIKTQVKVIDVNPFRQGRR